MAELPMGRLSLDNCWEKRFVFWFSCAASVAGNVMFAINSQHAKWNCRPAGWRKQHMVESHRQLHCIILFWPFMS